MATTNVCRRVREQVPASRARHHHARLGHTQCRWGNIAPESLPFLWGDDTRACATSTKHHFQHDLLDEDLTQEYDETAIRVRIETRNRDFIFVFVKELVVEQPLFHRPQGGQPGSRRRAPVRAGALRGGQSLDGRGLALPLLRLSLIHI